MPPKKKSTKIQKTKELKENTVPKTAKKDEENSVEIKKKTSSRTETRSKIRNALKVESEIVEENPTNKKKSTSKRKNENVDTEEREEKVLRVSSRSKKTEITEEAITEKRTSKRETKLRINDTHDPKDLEDEPKKGRKRATNKADEKSKVQSKRTKKVENDVSEPISKRQPRATKKKTTKDDVKNKEVESEDEAMVVKKKSTARKPKVEKEAKVLKNKTANDFESINYDCTRLNEHGKEWNLKIASWNVDGIRAWFNKGCLDYIAHEKPDIFCIQETKCSYEKLPDEIREYKGYHNYWCSADKDGYAGVGLMTKKMPLHVINGIEDPEHDSEGRVITAEFEKFYLCCVYVPNSGRGLVTMPKRLDWNEKFKKFVNDLNAKKPVIICGDMNVAHKEIDLKNPKTNKKTAGFTQEERDGMTDFLSNGYVDVFRKLYPDKEGAYTFWTYMMNSRAKNIGWRVDYFLLSERIVSNVCDNVIRSEVYGSDHCPLVLFLNM